MNDLMRCLSFTVMAVAVAAVVWTSSAAGQQPPPPVSDPTIPLTAEPSDGRGSFDVAVPTSLRQDAQPEPQDRFKPLDDLPPGEQLPAAPLLVSAYAFVMLAFFAYVLSVARRLGGVQREVERLERDIKKSGRA
jgi:hypothetical protein